MREDMRVVPEVNLSLPPPAVGARRVPAPLSRLVAATAWISGMTAMAAVTAVALAGISPALRAQDKPDAQDRPIGEVVTQNGKVRVEVLSLKRIEGNLVTLRWRIVNEGSSNFSMTPSNARLIDLVGRRQYEPGLTGSQCNAKPDERTVCWATYAAPPASTRTLAVKFYEQFDLLTGVPISD